MLIGFHRPAAAQLGPAAAVGFSDMVATVQDNFIPRRSSINRQTRRHLIQVGHASDEVQPGARWNRCPDRPTSTHPGLRLLRRGRAVEMTSGLLHPGDRIENPRMTSRSNSRAPVHAVLPTSLQASTGRRRRSLVLDRLDGVDQAPRSTWRGPSREAAARRVEQPRRVQLTAVAPCAYHVIGIISALAWRRPRPCATAAAHATSAGHRFSGRPARHAPAPDRHRGPNHPARRG